MRIGDGAVVSVSCVFLQVLKLYAWEASFSETVKGFRDEEVKLLKRLAMDRSLNVFFFNTTPFLVSHYLISSSQGWGSSKTEDSPIIICVISWGD